MRKFGEQPVISREFYDELMLVTDWAQDAPAEDLTKSQDLNRTGWCKICNSGFKPGGTADRVRLVQVGICWNCDNDVSRLMEYGKHAHLAYINGNIWSIAHEVELELDPGCSLEDIAAAAKKKYPPKWGKGCGGDISVIRFNDGRVVITDDLWGGGNVPERYKELMPDNAQFEVRL